MCVWVYVCAQKPTCATELLSLDLADAFVGQATGVATAGSAGLNGVVKQVVSQPLQMAVTHEGVLSQVAGREMIREREMEGGREGQRDGGIQ